MKNTHLDFLYSPMVQPNYNTPELYNADPNRKAFFNFLTHQTITRRDFRSIDKLKDVFEDLEYPSVVHVRPSCLP